MEFSFQGGTQLLPPIMLQLLKVEWLLLNHCRKSYKSKKKPKVAQNRLQILELTYSQIKLSTIFFILKLYVAFNLILIILIICQLIKQSFQ